MLKKFLAKIPVATLQQYSIKEEIAHSVTHGFGAILAIIGLTVLMVLTSLFGNQVHLVSYLIYGLSLVLLYTASTLYHALPSLNAKRFFKLCDHVSIYLLIAGTYTPFLALNLEGALKWRFIATIWSLAVTGIVFKLFFVGRYKYLSTLIYLGMGWLILIAFRPLSESMHSAGVFWLLLGGFFYTFGVVFYLLKKNTLSSCCLASLRFAR